MYVYICVHNYVYVYVRALFSGHVVKTKKSQVLISQSVCINEFHFTYVRVCVHMQVAVCIIIYYNYVHACVCTCECVDCTYACMQAIHVCVYASVFVCIFAYVCHCTLLAWI